MKREALDVVAGGPPCQSFRPIRRYRRFAHPDLRLWSIDHVEENAPELTGQARSDFERELRISALGFLIESPAATPLWRRICWRQMAHELRGRSAGQRLTMEMAIWESMR